MYYCLTLKFGDMKKVFVFILMCMVVAVAARAQVVNTEALTTDTAAVRLQPDSVSPRGEWQKVIETKLTATEGFKYGKQVLARMVPDCQRRMKLEVEEDAKIVVEVPMKLLEFFKLGKSKTDTRLTGSYMVTMTLLFKDGRYKVMAEDVTCSYQMRQLGMMIDDVKGEPFNLTNAVTNGALQNDMREEAGRVLLLFSRALEKQKADNDF